MRKFIFFKFLIFTNFFITHAQLELNGSYSLAKFEVTTGFGVNAGYEIPFKDQRFGIKPQIGYKCNCGYDDYFNAEYKNKIKEFHTTFFYKLIDNPKYELIPNLGFNLRDSYWSFKMNEPLDTIPIRLHGIGLREEVFSFSSVTGNDYKEFDFFTFGYSIQAQNRFKVNDQIKINISPFIEFDYDRSQSTGGGYIGLTYDFKE